MKKFRLKRVVLLAAIAVVTLVPARVALADGWGCQVLICLSDPRGPESEKECVPPIEKLWDALRHGNPFPTCDLVASLASLPAELVDAFEPGTLESYGKGSSASNTWASGGYCRKDLVGWGGHEQSELVCKASGAINVMINGQLHTRVWWGVNGGGLIGNIQGGPHTITENYVGPTPYPAYDPTKAGAEFLKEYQQRNDQGFFGGGGRH
ncbi:TPA: hypothetical protein QDC27_002655 [Burkholderia cepacia ATCC 25416]|jgi:hypothetical protein|uniref:Uncharacterized protein n=3 Tax=Burkholderia cepacia complex TaxID=87882 RepID=A0AAP4RAZ0_9BURK|nr:MULTISPECIES: hypothetical protein [Burkholderia]EJH9638093.1 hypothetical protein [Listeria monocytogenes]HDR9767730.1 hypothetical protein [Burkholderia cepacia ATCC 25416]ELK7725284.1 hypothetical protein [Burkholderia cenocepacia]MBA9834236.1 hypothetical protein [Burkholderia contaminans]MBD1415158.1 hypothetical protein [Burkholderia contaminans]